MPIKATKKAKHLLHKIFGKSGLKELHIIAQDKAWYSYPSFSGVDHKKYYEFIKSEANNSGIELVISSTDYCKAVPFQGATGFFLKTDGETKANIKHCI